MGGKITINVKEIEKEETRVQRKIFRNTLNTERRLELRQ
jgi:hypothetical protein